MLGCHSNLNFLVFLLIRRKQSKNKNLDHVELATNLTVIPKIPKPTEQEYLKNVTITKKLGEGKIRKCFNLKNSRKFRSSLFGSLGRLWSCYEESESRSSWRISTWSEFVEVTLTRKNNQKYIIYIYFDKYLIFFAFLNSFFYYFYQFYLCC